MADDTITYVPARYKGEHAVRLAPRRGGYKHGDGTARAGDDALLLKPGETLLLPATELYGETLLVDPSGLASSVRSLGVGFAPLPEHVSMTRDELVGARFLVDGLLRSYEFHDGRSDFEPVETSVDATSDATSETSDTSTAKRSRSAKMTPGSTESTESSAAADDAAQGA